MKLNQLRDFVTFELGIPTSGNETRDELVRLLQAHIDAEGGEDDRNDCDNENNKYIVCWYCGRIFYRAKVT